WVSAELFISPEILDDKCHTGGEEVKDRLLFQWQSWGHEKAIQEMCESTQKLQEVVGCGLERDSAFLDRETRGGREGRREELSLVTSLIIQFFFFFFFFFLVFQDRVS
ncbi:hypothetical protein LEMLEM_LOCUS16528, partial [Lemmus lemmus]